MMFQQVILIQYVLIQVRYLQEIHKFVTSLFKILQGSAYTIKVANEICIKLYHDGPARRKQGGGQVGLKPPPNDLKTMAIHIMLKIYPVTSSNFRI